MKRLKDDIKNRAFKRVYLIYGNESYLVKQLSTALVEAVASGDMADMNSNMLSGKSVTAQMIADSVEDMPFFSDYRAVVVENSGLFSTGRKDETAAVTELVKHIPDSTVLIFVESEADKRLALYKAVEKTGYCVELKTLSGNGLTEWLTDNSSGRMKRSEADYMLRYVGSDMTMLSSELNKLVTYVGDRYITKEDINNVCTPSLESNIFNMVAAIGNKKPQTALDIYNNLLFMKQSPLYVLKMIARQFRLILQCKYLAKKGMAVKMIAAELKSRDFIVQNCLQQGKNFTMGVLMQAIRECADCDVKYKRGLISDRLVVEILILKYSR